jgi:hypothetical protein
MKKLIALVIILFPALAWSQPAIEFRQEKQDFGFVRQGEVLEFNFELTNNGTELLDIKGVNTS